MPYFAARNFRRALGTTVADPVMTTQRGEGLGDGFVEGFCRHVERVRGLVQIVDNDGTSSKSHDSNLSCSLFVRQSRPDASSHGKQAEARQT